ncbi:type IV secretion system protein [Salmonella enterica]
MAGDINITIVATLFSAIDDTITNTIASGASKLMSTVSPIFGMCICIYFGLKALSWYTKGADMPVMELFEDFVKMTLICFFSFNVGNYLHYIVPIISGLSDDISQLLSSNNSTNANSIDQLLSDYITMICDYIDTMTFSPISDFSATATGVVALVVMLVGGLPFIVITCAILLTVKIGTSLFLIIGPLFIGFSLFSATRDLFFGWLRMVSSFVLINVFFSLVCTIEMNFIRSQFINSDATWTKIGSMIVCFGAFTFLAKALPSFASSVTGGMGIAGISAPDTKTRKLYASAGKMAGRMAGRAATRALQSRGSTLKPG